MTEVQRIARRFVQANNLTLSEQLALSVFVAQLEAALAENERVAATLAANIEKMGTTDPERGWRLT